jgi:hypothetical protein
MRRLLLFTVLPVLLAALIGFVTGRAVERRQTPAKIRAALEAHGIRSPRIDAFFGTPEMLQDFLKNGKK